MESLVRTASYLPGLRGQALKIAFDAVGSNPNPNPWRAQDILKRGLMKNLAVDTVGF